MDTLVELYEKHRRRIYTLCFNYLRNRSDAEDATQETFARAARAATALTGDLAPFLTTVAQNVCRDELRRRRFRAPELPETTMAPVSLETQAMTDVELSRVWQGLTGGERSLLGLLFAGFSYGEIARRTGRTTRAISSGIVRARRRAREMGGTAAAWLGGCFWRGAAWGRWHRTAASSSPAAPAMMVALTMAGGLVAGILAVPLAGAGTRSAGGAAYASSIAEASLMLDGATVAHGQLRADGAAIAAAGPANRANGSGADVPGHHGATGVGAAFDAAHGVVDPTGDATTADTAFASLTASPSYAHDHTVFAPGYVNNGCQRPTCPVLFQTTDGGHSWTNLHSVGFLGGTIALPPVWPADPTIFADGQAGLQRSDDGGRTFTLAAPVSGPAAVAVDSPAGDARVLIASKPMWLYHAASRTLTPVPALPADAETPDAVAALAGGRFLVGTRVADATAAGVGDAVVYNCSLVSCTQVFRETGSLVDEIEASPSAGIAALRTGLGVQVSRDGGMSFAPVAMSPSLAATVIALPADGAANTPIFIGAEDFSVSPPRPLLLQASVSGSTTDVSTAVRSAAALLDLPDGRMLLGTTVGTSDGRFGVQCSSDRGRTWSDTCATAA